MTNLIVKPEGEARIIQRMAPGDTLPPGFVVYDGDPLKVTPEGNFIYINIPDPPYIRPQTAQEEKDSAAAIKKVEIREEQELRSSNIDLKAGDKLAFQLPSSWFQIMEELYTDLVVPGARNPIDQTETPGWYWIKELGQNRKDCHAALQTWVDDPTKTAEDILNFDVASWPGWSVERPPNVSLTSTRSEPQGQGRRGPHRR